MTRNMNNAELGNLLDDVVVKEKVEQVWAEVFKASSVITQQAQKFGFEQMAHVPKPNIHEMLIALRIFNSIIDILLSSAEDLNVAFDETRLMLNAKQQLLRMEMIANALKANDRDAYNQYTRELEIQSCI